MLRRAVLVAWAVLATASTLWLSPRAWQPFLTGSKHEPSLARLVVSLVAPLQRVSSLVRQAAQGTFENFVVRTIQKAAWCSSDPVCVESLGQEQRTAMFRRVMAVASYLGRPVKRAIICQIGYSSSENRESQISASLRRRSDIV